MWLMRHFLLIIAVVALVGCGGKKPKQQAEANATVTPKPEPPKAVTVNITNPIVEEAIRNSLKKPEGKLTEADLAKVTELNLRGPKITDAGLKDIAKMQQLTRLRLSRTKVTKAGVAELQKALPKCKIFGP